MNIQRPTLNRSNGHSLFLSLSRLLPLPLLPFDELFVRQRGIKTVELNRVKQKKEKKEDEEIDACHIL